MRQRRESTEKIRNMFQLHIALYLSRICEESGILPSKLTMCLLLLHGCWQRAQNFWVRDKGLYSWPSNMNIILCQFLQYPASLISYSGNLEGVM